ncbi:MAG: LytTR family DNA-binding domain-containing protein [Puniceicoccales bacterium]|jgi:DNA-binding LytR/AlgR family response regulator|nr:LytTR family DNA-binding domain-containing protein [Puniceicoccales bacterium]
MKVLIVEDEITAQNNLKHILAEADSTVEVIGCAESVAQTVKWLRRKTAPDLIFMDVQLSDGSAFNIFKHQTLETPIVFTTAFDEFAIAAFRVNSVDYLLKPIDADKVRGALEKFRRFGRHDLQTYLDQLSRLVPPDDILDRLLVAEDGKLVPVPVSEVAFFYSTEEATRATLFSGGAHPYGKTLEGIARHLEPREFFRANKQFIVAKKAVRDITVWMDNRLLVTLCVETPESIYVSKNRAAEFKTWLTSK